MQETTPLANIMQEDDSWSDEAMELVSYQMCAGLLLQSVEFHTQKLGVHNYIFTGEFRFHVWENEENNWRVYVNNQKGVTLEVPVGSTKEEARKAWDNYRERMMI